MPFVRPRFRLFRLSAIPAWPRRRMAWAAAWLIATVALVVFVRAADLRTIARQMAQARPGWLLLAVVANFAVLPVMTEQWFRLAPREWGLRRSDLWPSVAIGMAAMNTLPFGGGHAVAVGLLAARGTGIGGGVTLMGLEQFCDGWAKLAVLLAALAVAPLPPMWHSVAWAVIALIVPSLVALRWLGRTSRTSGWRARLARHLEAVRRPGVLVVAIGLSLMMRGIALLAIYAVQRSLGLTIPFAETTVILAAVTFGTAMAVSPGNLGVFEVATIAAYRLIGVPPAAAAALALAQHACFLLPILGAGYGSLAWWGMRPRAG